MSGTVTTLTEKSAGEGEGGDCSSIGEVGEGNGGERLHWLEWYGDRTILMLGA